ncbi:DUF3788 domain-containing protein [Puteibacter caeruleilacunae]|nr:DUF3788 domain-containing protein [Puteibacter caeruleilacunae]
MAASIFDDKLVEPNESQMQTTLGDTYELYQEIRSFIKKTSKEFTPEWKHYGKSSGWLLKLYSGKRNVLFVLPCDGYLKTSFIFGVKAVDAVMNSTIPDKHKTALNNARKYAEGRGLQIEVQSWEDVDTVKELIKIKLAN